MTAEVRITGAEQFTALARDLAKAGTEGRGLRLALLKQLRTIAKPIQTDIQRGYFNLPAKGPKSSGLRLNLMRAVRTSILTSTKNATVTVLVDASKLPAEQANMPNVIEDGTWRHQVYGHDWWVSQSLPPVVAPVAAAHQNDASIAANAAVAETILKLEKGNYIP